MVIITTIISIIILYTVVTRLNTNRENSRQHFLYLCQQKCEVHSHETFTMTYYAPLSPILRVISVVNVINNEFDFSLFSPTTTPSIISRAISKNNISMLVTVAEACGTAYFRKDRDAAAICHCHSALSPEVRLIIRCRYKFARVFVHRINHNASIELAEN